MRESCMHYARVALELWQRHMLEPFKQQLQTAISVRVICTHAPTPTFDSHVNCRLQAGLSDASPKGRETARICYWFVLWRVVYLAIYPALYLTLYILMSGRKYIAIWPDQTDRYMETSFQRGFHVHNRSNTSGCSSGSTHRCHAA